MDDIELRDKALAYAVAVGGNAKAIVTAATDFYAFLTTGNASPSASKSSATSGAKDSKADAPAPDTAASTPSSDSPATSTPASGQSERAGSTQPTSGESGQTTTSTATSPSEPVSRTDAMKAMGQFMNLKGEAATVKVLDQFGATKFSEIKPEQYGELIAAFENEV